MPSDREETRIVAALRPRADAVAWGLATISAVLIWGFMFGVLFGGPNFAEALLGGGTGISVAVIVRALVLSKLTS